MDEKLGHLLLSEQVVSLDSDSLRIYLLLRADIATCGSVTVKFEKSRQRLVSGMSVHAIALKVSLPDLTVKRILDDLARRCWVKRLEGEAYQLGVIEGYNTVWFINTVPAEKALSKPSEVIKKKLDEDRERIEARKAAMPKISLSDSAKRELARESGLLAKPSVILLEAYRKKYYAKYGINAPLPSGDNPISKAHIYLKRLHDWCNKDDDFALRLMDWAFDNWSMLKGVFHVAGDLDLSLLCTKSIVERMKEYIVKGIPEIRARDRDGIGSRADTKAIEESKEIGW